MPMFMSEEDFRQCSGDTGMVAERADAYIRQLLGQIETFRAEADATSITREQNCSLIEQKYVSLSAACSAIQSRQQQLLLQSIEKDREIERMKREASEVHNSKRQQKDLELNEKNAHLDKIVLYEIEEKAAVIMDEREEHGRFLEAYSALENKLQHSLSEHSTLEMTIQDLKACLKRQERDYDVAQKEIIDLQKQLHLKSKWETESSAIEVYKSEADKKYKEVDKLNKILHSRVVALQIKLAENERGGSSSQSLAGDDGFQSVVNYLRRCKEISDTELSLSKQENLRLNSQLEIALKAAEAAQTSLQAEREKSREEELKSLQFKIRELTLQLELESCRREIDALKVEKADPQKKIDELMEKYKDFDIDDYNRVKESCHQMEVNIRGKDALLEEFQKLVSEKENTILNLEKLLSERQDALSRYERDLDEIVVELSDRESRITEISKNETYLKSQLEKARRINNKEKEKLKKEVQALSKQLEDAKQTKQSSKRPSTLSHSDLPEETTADVPMPLLKKLRPSEGNEEPTKVTQIEESMAEEPKVDEHIQADTGVDENLDRSSKIVLSDNQLRYQDNKPIVTESGRRDEGDKDVVSTQGGLALSPQGVGKPVSPAINLTDRRLQMRQDGMGRSVGGSTSRGRGRVVHGRTGRGPWESGAWSYGPGTVAGQRLGGSHWLLCVVMHQRRGNNLLSIDIDSMSYNTLRSTH